MCTSDVAFFGAVDVGADVVVGNGSERCKSRECVFDFFTDGTYVETNIGY